SRTSASARTTSCWPRSPTSSVSRRSAAVRRETASSCYSPASPSSCRATATSAEPSFPGFLEVRARAGADHRLPWLAVLEQDHGRDREHAVAGRVAGIVVDVHLCERDALLFLGELLEDRGDGAARAAPRGPEVDHDGRLRLQDVGFERVVGDGLHRPGSYPGRRFVKPGVKTSANCGDPRLTVT